MNIAQTLDTTYTTLLEEVTNPRQRASLERLKAACDYLDSHGLKITPTTVEGYCLDRKWDGPKAQSIRNSKEVLLRYIELRRSGQTVHKTQKSKNGEPDIADESLRAYVQLLKQERDQAVAAKARIEAGLRTVPGIRVDDLLRSALTGAPASDPAPVAVLPEAVRQGLLALLDEGRLANCGLELFKGRVRNLITKNVLLERAEVEALQAVLSPASIQQVR